MRRRPSRIEIIVLVRTLVSVFLLVSIHVRDPPYPLHRPPSIDLSRSPASVAAAVARCAATALPLRCATLPPPLPLPSLQHKQCPLWGQRRLATIATAVEGDGGGVSAAAAVGTAAAEAGGLQPWRQRRRFATMEAAEGGGGRRRAAAGGGGRRGKFHGCALCSINVWQRFPVASCPTSISRSHRKYQLTLSINTCLETEELWESNFWNLK